jgi:transcriptional regulator with XRE-family HTH domain
MNSTEKRTPAEPIYAEVGKRIADLRKQQNLTQRGLAERVNFTHQLIAMYEIGERRISLIALVEIAKALQTNLSELIPERYLRNE